MPKVNQNDILDNLINEMRYGSEYRSLDENNNWVIDHEAIEARTEEVNAHIEKLQSVGNVYSKADRIITGDPVEVRIEDNPDMDTTAYNDGKNIVFNAHLLEDVTDESIVSLHGFNYHEVAHVLWTPRGGSEFGTTIRQEGLARAFNILEDSRIERLLIAKYPAVAPFLEASCLEYILKGNSEEFADYFPLFTGRKYLDIELRQELADRFIKRHGVATAQLLSVIIHEYRTLVFPRDYARALDILRQFAQIVGTDDQPQGNSPIPQDGGGHGDRAPMGKGRMEGNKQQQALQDKASKQEAGSGAGEENLDEPADNTNANDTTGLADEDTQEDKALKDKINKALDNLIKSDDVKRDTQEVRKAIRDNSNSHSAIKQGSYTNSTVSPKLQVSAKAFAVAMERLRIDNDPAWELEVESGRLNIGRAMKADINDINRLFDRWSEGNSNNDIEAVVLVDTSGSMSWQIQRTMESAWTIKRGIERINGRVSVYKFNHDSRLVYGADEKAKPTEYRFVNSSGGTNPYKALVEAQRILRTSRRGVKILFVVTDGSWDMTEQNDKIIKDLSNEGVMTSVAFLGDMEWWKNNDRERYEAYLKEVRHGAQVMRVVSEPRDLVDIAKDLVKLVMGKRH
jgi:Mg-chelatase subunit ChlD